ncbi:MAG: 3-deoxy-8-phosphooctulonate synthase [Planctomycetes bacterium]|nr:3-deoxy-8-phosphooctulonate synthase [Planctomycetota bacterium]
MKNLQKSKIINRKSGGLFLIAGPCVIESRELVFEVARELKKITDALTMPFIFKASFDKANRTSNSSFRGIGMDEGLRILAEVGAEFEVPVLTDVHESWQAQPVSEAVQVLQIPAFLCRQTDLIEACAKTNATLNIKKGQFLAPEQMGNVAKKATLAGAKELWLTERGATFGYGDLVSDMRSIPIMKRFGFPVIFDGTHSVQKPGGLGDVSGGMREFVPTLVKAAVAAGCDGLFMETHPNPDKALSDGPNMVPLAEIRALLETAQRIYDVVR